MNGFRCHVEIIVAHGLDDLARRFELAARIVTDARSARDIARVVEGQRHVVVFRLVDIQDTAIEAVGSEFEYVLRHRVVRVEEIPRACKRVQEVVRDAPGVAAFTENDAFDAEFFRGVADTQRNIAHVVVVADEQAEVRGFRSLRTHCPADAGGVEHLGVADQAVDVRFREEVGRRGYQQYISAFFIQRESHLDAGIIFDFFLKAFQGIGQRGFRQAEVVADLEDLGDDLVRVFLTLTDVREYIARSHRDFGGIDAVRAEHRAATAFGTLVVVAVHFIDDFFSQIDGADQFREQFAGQGEVAAVDLAQQVLTRDRHVLRVGGAEEIMAFVGAGAAFHADVHEHLQ